MKRDEIQVLCDKLRNHLTNRDDDATIAQLLEDAYLGTSTSNAAYQHQIESTKMRELLTNMATELRTLRVMMEDNA